MQPELTITIVSNEGELPSRYSPNSLRYGFANKWNLTRGLLHPRVYERSSSVMRGLHLVKEKPNVEEMLRDAFPALGTSDKLKIGYLHDHWPVAR